MGKPSRFDRLRPLIAQVLADSPRRVLALQDLRRLRQQLAPRMSEPDFVAFLLKEQVVQRVRLKSPRYPGFTRYVRPGASPFEVALSLRKGSYLSHASAVFLHALSEQIPRRIFINREQSAKPEWNDAAPLRQESVDRAFSHPQREAQYILEGPGYEVVLLSGKQTGRLEVGVLQGPGGERLEVTKLERTLIDITVRPLYAGGVYQVLEAYRTAKERISVGVLLATLKKLEYRYPYHQAIGFYMERAGYDETLLRRVEQLGADLDFYLTYGLRRRLHSSRWRLFYPEGL